MNDGENGCFVARGYLITMIKVIYGLLYDHTLVHNMSNDVRETTASLDWDEDIITMERLL